MRKSKTLRMVPLVILLLMACQCMPVQVKAQPPGWSGDDNFAFLLLINNVSAAESNSTNPIPILLSEDPVMNLTILTGDDIILHSGTFVMSYMGVPLFNQDFPFNAPVPSGTNLSLMNTTLPLSAALGGSGVDLVSGTIKGSFSFVYSLISTPGTNVTVTDDFFLHVGPTGPAALLSVSGMITVGFTLMAVFGLLLALDDFQQGILAAGKVRKAVRESRLIIYPREMVLRRKPRKRDELPSIDELKSKVRSLAQGMWDGRRCPSCRAKWKSKADACSKCNISRSEAEILFAEKVSELVPKALDVMRPKSKITIGAFSKRLRVKPDVGGALAAALIDLGIFQSRTVKVPLKKVAFSGMTLAGTYWSWMQIIGGATPAWIDVLLSVAGGLVVSVVIGYFLNWLARLPRLGYDSE